MNGVVHIAAQAVQIGPNLLRQRCAWCGAVLIDEDLSRVGTAVTDENPDPSFPTWQAGGLVRVDGAVHCVVEHNDGDRLPPDCCGMLDPAVTA